MIRNPGIPDIPLEGVTVCVCTTEEIVKEDTRKQRALAAELAALFSRVFVFEKDWKYVVRHYFHRPAPLTRFGVFLRKNGALLATMSFDMGPVRGDGQEVRAGYIHIRALDPALQGMGVGTAFSSWILQAFSPDYLMTTCVTSPSLHSWIRLVTQLPGYAIWPHKGDKRDAVPLPVSLIPPALSVFSQVYQGHVKGDIGRVEAVIRNLTVGFVRKGVGMSYGKNQWQDPRPDPLAAAMGLTPADGVLVVIRKGDQGE